MEVVVSAERWQPLIEGQIADSGWSFRTARFAGYVDFFEQAGVNQSVAVAGAPIIAAGDMHNKGREIYARTEKIEYVVRRDPVDEQWKVASQHLLTANEGMGPDGRELRGE